MASGIPKAAFSEQRDADVARLKREIAVAYEGLRRLGISIVGSAGVAGSPAALDLTALTARVAALAVDLARLTDRVEALEP